ncbi:ATP-dependent nuclease [Giesbergeria anulus]|uniref:Predicted ATP-dependent endonuclease of the OLD family, contains P-loop ATPase and TOPRIM domains n=1 Tax=Giesbergeria anulus TaxID=180197 RepID=A0A1H9SVU3_9BURK|nr:AAA family ATPase [Giesbergeria anulus]SER88957.1 Predicted ATP-dependent endonuclease of the OLD family, contains P-loop ATPase and TOPRIM domains [Giesbergeria anulus]
MKLKSIRIKNFRTIKNEQQIDFHGKTTIVGPNNTGKTNILRAIEMFFTGFKNKLNYTTENDLTFGSEGAQTVLIGSFTGNPEGEDKEFYQIYKEMHNYLEITKKPTTDFQIYLYFSKNGTPTYKIFPNEKAKNKYQATLKKQESDAINILLNQFICHYIPSSKNIYSLYETLLLPFIKSKIADELQEKTTLIQSKLNEISSNINNQLTEAAIDNLKIEISIPDNSIEKIISSFSLNISDPETTEISKKGMGIQSTTMLSSFLWITKEEIKKGKSVIWLIEEPESYLHPKLATSCEKIINNLQKESLVILSTHALAFVSKNPTNTIGTTIDENKNTRFIKYKTYTKATESIRNSLGVKFGDYFNLGIYNCFVEGESDREIFKWVLEKIPASNNELEYARQCEFMDLDGVSGIESFMKSNYYIINNERAVITIIDGDDAGIRVRKILQGFFGEKKIPFEANKDFISLPTGFSIEGLFPPEWIIEIHKENPKWFKNFSVDMNGKIQPFEIEDAKKRTIQELLMKKAGNESNTKWANQFIQILTSLDKLLLLKSNKIEVI